MRILHISTRLILGGSQENTLLSCEGQVRLGHEVHLAFGPIHGPEGTLLPRVVEFNRRCTAGEERAAGGGACGPIVPHEVKSLVREVSPWTDWRCYGELRRLIREVRPDVVHTHSSKAGIIGRAAAWAEAARARAAGRPLGVVHTIHGPPFMPVEGRVVQRAIVRLNNAVYTLAERYAAKRCDVIVSVADAMTRQFLARGIGRTEQYVTVRSGMDAGEFVHARPGESREQIRSALGIGERELVVGTVARLAQHKGHDDLLSALSERDGGLVEPWTLLWVGDGWWRERLIVRARGLGLDVIERDRGEGCGSNAGAGGSGGARLIVTGLVPPERVPGLMRAMDVLAHPSSREGLPRTVPQALLSGVCPVAYDCDGTPEICRNGETGLLVRTGDVEDLRRALVWAAGHPAERAALAARGREECRSAFAAETMVAGLERVYSAAIKRAGERTQRTRSSSSR